MLDNIRKGAGSWAVKIIFGIIILVFVFWGVGNFSSIPRHSVAEVNGESITLQAMLREAEANIENFRRGVPDFASDKEAQTRFKEAVVRELVQRAVRRQEAERLGIFVSHVEVSAVIASIPLFQDDQGKFDDVRYKAFLKARGWTQAQFQEDTRLGLLDEKLMALITSGVGLSEAEAKSAFDFGLARHSAEYVLFAAADYRDKAQVSDNDIAAYYETNKDAMRLPARVDLDYIELSPKAVAANLAVTDEEIAAYYEAHASEFIDPAGYTSRQIILRLPPADSPEFGKGLGAAQARMGEIQEKLAGGAAFADLAREYSDDPMSRALGGEMGFFPEGVLPVEVDKTAFALAPGQVGGPVQSPAGLHLILLENKREARKKPLADVRDEIREKVALAKAGEAMADLQAKAEEALRLGTDFNKIAGELKVPVKHTGLVPREEAVALLTLHKDSAASLAAAPAGRAVPSPLTAADGAALVFVKETRPEEIPSLEAVKNDIAAALKRGQAETMAYQAAEKALPEFTGNTVPAAYASRALTSENFSVAAPAVRPLSESQGLAEDLLAAPEGNWLPKVHRVAEGAVIARRAASTPPSADEWSGLKDIFMKNLLQRKREDVAAAFMTNLLQKAEISVNPEAVDQINLR